MTVYDSIAQSIAVMEGYGKPGTIATDQHNPGALRKSGYPVGRGKISVMPDDATGWAEELALIQRKFARHPNWTMIQFFGDESDGWAPGSETGNDPYNYASFVIGRLNADTGRYFTLASTLASIASGVASNDATFTPAGDIASPDTSMPQDASLDPSMLPGPDQYVPEQAGFFDSSIAIAGMDVPMPVVMLASALVVMSIGGRRR